MALRINPVTGLQEQVKEEVSSAAKLREATTAKTAVEKLNAQFDQMQALLKTA